MSDHVDTMAWLRAEGAPWHKKGTVMETVPQSGEEAMRLAGLDWSVRPVHSAALYQPDLPTNGNVLGSIQMEAAEEEGEQEKLYVVQGQDRYIVREDTGRILGTVGPTYEPMQNREAFAFFDSALGAGKAQYVTAGSLKGGRVIWSLVRMPGWLRVGSGDDRIGKYLLLTTSHDGSMALWVSITPIRVVCWNTLSAAVTQAKSKNSSKGQVMARFWHTKGLKKKMDDFGEELARIRKIYEQTEEAFNSLARYEVSTEEVEQYIELLFPIAEDAKRPSRMENIRTSVLDRFEGHGMGSDLDTAKGTAWGLYNAVAEHVDHERGQDENRLHSAWYGSGSRLKERALEQSLYLLN